MKQPLFTIFNSFSDLVIGFSDITDGPMKVSGSFLKKFVARQNRKKFFSALDVSSSSAVRAELVHGNKVVIVRTRDAGSEIAKTDGLITGDKNLFLSVTIADCLPIFIYDPVNKTISLIHASWRGLKKEILSVAIKKLIDGYQSKTENLIIGIGPGISRCHFEVKDDVLSHFKSFLPETLESRNGKRFLDLKQIAKLQLQELGVQEKNIAVNPFCTYCQKDKYYSYRRDKPKSIEAMVAVFGIKA